MAHTLATHPILASGPGTRARMAAFRKVARECGPDESLIAVLNAALLAYSATDAEPDAEPTNGRKDAEPSDPTDTDTAERNGKVGTDAPKRGRGRPKGSRDSKPRKRRADAGKPRKPQAEPVTDDAKRKERNAKTLAERLAKYNAAQVAARSEEVASRK